MAGSGDIVVVNFPGAQGTKRRPAIVLSTDAYHRARPDVILGLITSQTSTAVGPTDYVLGDWRAAGLHQPSAFRAYLVTLPHAAISAKVGRASDVDWQAIKDRVKAAIET